MKKINDQISINLRRIRKEQGLTLDELAEKTGVSKSMLGEIERGGTNPTILTLWKISDGLKIPLTFLMSETEPEYKLVRTAEVKPITQTVEYDIGSIFPFYNAHKNEIFRLKIAPHSRLANAGHLNGIDEFIFVVSGKVGLTLDGDEMILNEGDSIRFKGALTHAIHNDQEESAVLINILYYTSSPGASKAAAP
jgi:XRE family transcriptional regulator, regulator of sulfur utilization